MTKLQHTTSSSVNKILRLLELDELDLISSDDKAFPYTAMYLGGNFQARMTEQDLRVHDTTRLELQTDRLTLGDLSGLLNLNPGYQSLYALLGFSNVKVTVTASPTHDRETLIISGDVLSEDEHKWHFLGLDVKNPLPISSLQLKVRLSHKKGSFRKNYQVFVAATLTLGNQHVQVAMDFPIGYEGVWNLRLIPPGVTVSLSDLSKLFKDANAFRWISKHEEEDKKSFSLDHLKLQFIPSAKSGESKFLALDFAVSSRLDWSLIDNVLTLKSAGFGMSIRNDRELSYSMTIEGVLKIGKDHTWPEMHARIDLPQSGEASLVAHTQEEATFSALPDVSGLLESEDLSQHLPTAWPEKGLNFSISELKLTWNWEAKIIKQLTLRLSINDDAGWIVWSKESKKKSEDHHLVLYEFELDLQLSRPGDTWLSQGFVKGSSKVEGVDVAVQLDKTTTGNWQLYLNHPIGFSFEALSSISKTDLTKEQETLPATLKASGTEKKDISSVQSEIELRDFRVHFTSSPWQVTYGSFHIETTREIEIVQGVDLLEAVVYLQIEDPFGHDRFIRTAQLGGRLKIGDHHLRLVSEKNETHTDWTFLGQSDPGESISFTALFQKMLKNAGTVSAADHLPEISVSDLNFTYVPNQSNLEFSGNSTLQVTDLLTSEVALEMEHTGGDNARWLFHGTGYLSIDKVVLQVDVVYDSKGNQGLTFNADLDGELPVSTFLQQGFAGSTALPGTLSADFSIRDVHFETQPHRHAFLLHGESELDLGAFLPESWDSTLTLNFTVRRVDCAPEALPKPITYDLSVTGTLDIPKPDGHLVSFRMTGVALAGQNGWQLDGSLQSGTLSLDELMGLISDAYEIRGFLPSSLRHLTITKVNTSFDTYRQDLSFDFEAQIATPGSSELLLNAMLKLEHAVEDKVDHVQTRISGSLTFDGLVFELSVDQSGDTNWWVGTFKDLEERPKSLTSWANQLLGLEIAAQWSVNIHEAVLACERPESNEDPIFLFATHIDSGIDLSRLPLVGRFLSTAKLKLDFQLSAASKTIPNLSEVNDLLPQGIAPFTEESFKDQQFQIQVQLSYGGKVIPFKLPVKVKSQGVASNPESDASSSTAETTSPIAFSSDHPHDDSTKWEAINKHFGPLYVRKLGRKYENKRLQLALDAALISNGLAIELEGMSCSLDLDRVMPGDLKLENQSAEFGLDGLSVDFRKGLLEIGAALLRDEDGEYNGTAILRFKQLSIGAIASYTTIDDHPSMFVYASLNTPLGGPPFFFVTGLSAGFGYNRKLTMPSVDRVRDFPLVAEGMEGQALPPGAGKKLLMKELEAIKSYVPPSEGDLFFAVGINFSTFKLINSTLLLTASFGTHTAFNLLGVSTLNVPSAGSKTAFVQMQIKGAYLPEEGFAGLSGQLSPDSYIFSKKCHLTGGFAFYTWFSGENEGDFVMTIGGYHPHFNKPEHYPVVPRIGLNWKLDDHTQVKGEAYFAMCANAIMAGGLLEANYHKGSLHAYFRLAANFLANWQPFHYEASIRAHIGGSYTYHLFGSHHISVDLGADVKVWGPEFGGEAELDLYVTSVKMSFGADKVKPPRLNWADFKAEFLPDSLIHFSTGRAKALPDLKWNDDRTIPNHQVLPKDFPLEIQLAVPATAIDGKVNKYPAELGIRPMQETSLESNVTIEISKKGYEGNINEDFVIAPIYKQVPAALWSSDAQASLHEDRFIEKTITGFTITPKTSKSLTVSNDSNQYQLTVDGIDYKKAQVAQSEIQVEHEAITTTSTENSIEETFLESGQYKLRITQHIDVNENIDPEILELGFHVSGERFRLSADQIRAVSPPQNGVGQYDQVYPEISFDHRNLLWERSPFAEKEEDQIPWLSILVFSAEEWARIQRSTLTLGSLKNGAGDPFFPKIALEPGQWDGDEVQVIDIPFSSLGNGRLEDLQSYGSLKEVVANDPSSESSEKTYRPSLKSIRVPKPGINYACLVSLEGRFNGKKLIRKGENVRFVELYNWTFTHVEEQVQPQVVSVDWFSKFKAYHTQYSALDGSSKEATYHGPLLNNDHANGLKYGDQDPKPQLQEQNGVTDITYRTGWELGRQLAISHPRFTTALRNWRLHQKRLDHHKEQKEWLNASHLLKLREETEQREIPEIVSSFLRDINLLKGIPFQYLVPNENWLPAESLRLFKLDKHWIHAVEHGALSIGRVSSKDYAGKTHDQLADLNIDLIGYSGFLFRSNLVSNWKDLSVKGRLTDNKDANLLRLERLGSDIVIGIFDQPVSQVKIVQAY